MIRKLCILFVFLSCTFLASLEEDYFATNHWPSAWSAYATDAALGQALDQVKVPTDLPAKDHAYAQLQAVRTAIGSVRQTPAEDLLLATLAARGEYARQTFLARVRGVHREADPDRTVWARQVSRTAERVLSACEAEVVRHERKLEGGAAGDTYLRAATLLVERIQTRGALAQKAPEILSRAVSGVIVPFLALALFLLLTRRSLTPLLLAVPIVVATQVHVAFSIGSLPLRGTALRQLDTLYEVWLPLWAMLGGVLFAYLARSKLLACLANMLVFYRSRAGIRWRISVVIALAVLAGLLIKGDALRSEVWLLLAALTLAMFSVRNATHMVIANDTSSTFGSPFLWGLTLILLGLTVYLDDFGSLALSLVILGACAVIFLPYRWAKLAALGICVGFIGWAALLASGSANNLRGALPSRFSYALERVLTPLSPTAAAASDLPRALWLARAGLQNAGFGLVALPAEGFSAERPADRNITQLPADYFSSLMIAVHGWVGFILIIGFSAALIVMARSALSLLGSDRNGAEQLLAAFAGYGLIFAAARTVLTLAGASGALPLTGVPAPLLSLGMGAAISCGFFIGVACCTACPKISASRRMR